MENGQTATATWNGTTVEGAIVQVDLSMNQAKKAFAVDVVFDNSKQLMRTGVTARIAIETYRGENTIFIERKNIITEDTARFVFLNDNGVAKRQAVATGHSNGTDVEILSGLVPGDELIVEGQMLLKDNMKLNLTGSN